METVKKIIKIIWLTLVYGFAATGFVLVAGFFAVKFHWTDEPGTIDPHNQRFRERAAETDTVTTPELEQDAERSLATVSAEISRLEAIRAKKAELLCDIANLGDLYPVNAANILAQYRENYDDALAENMLFAAHLRLDDLGETVPQQCDPRHVTEESVAATLVEPTGANLFPWINDEEWGTIREAIVKDTAVINQAAAVAEIDPRFIVANLTVEQLRLFHTQRELYEKFFQPLSILGNATKISWGVMGIKEATAKDIERHLTDPASPYYLGTEHEDDLTFTTDDHDGERYRRLTDEKDHYYSYLYAGLYLKQILTQWTGAGYSIENRPEIVGTLFNVGFSQSRPKTDPVVGGSKITIRGKQYSFGSLSFEFFYSGELAEEFPLQAS